jgi:hypothetical protein
MSIEGRSSQEVSMANTCIYKDTVRFDSVATTQHRKRRDNCHKSISMVYLFCAWLFFGPKSS